MKLVLEVLLAIFLHPIAVVLAIINIAGRDDLNTAQKVLWVIVCIFAWGIGPILYIVFSGGRLW